jgi:T5SS/PEP-CTERM-associated repeat protein
MKQHTKFSARMIGLLAAPVALASASLAAINTTGDVEPANPATWDSTTVSTIGNTSDGTLTVNAGSQITSSDSTLGNQAGVTGVATVDGAGSTWNLPGIPETSGILNIGNSGTGIFNVTNGAVMTSEGGNLGNNAGSSGTANVSGANSAWNVGDGFDVGTAGVGALNITGGATARSGDFTNDVIGDGNIGTVTVDGAGSTWSEGDFGNENLWIGSGPVSGTVGSGFLRITNGGTVNSDAVCDFGNLPGASGTALVSGAGSTWNVANEGINLGAKGGSGTLSVNNGGQVIFGEGASGIDVGSSQGASGIATVSDPGSSLQGRDISIGGNGGTGVFNLVNGALVSVGLVNVNSSGLLAMDIGEGSSFQVRPTGAITNDAIMRFEASPAAIAGNVYTPVTAQFPVNGSFTWSGTGTFQALGGTWDSTAHTFTVSSVASGTSGQAVHIDQSSQQRIFIDDPATGKNLFANFLSSTTPTSLSLTATPLTSDQAASLQGMLGSNGSVLSGWTFSTDGYTSGDPVYLSLSIGSGFSSSSLELWHFDGTNWTPFNAGDLSYDGTYASFTVTGFSGYAVASAPEPASIVMLGLGAGMLLRRRARENFNRKF